MHVVDFLEAVRRVAAGGTALDPDVVAELLVLTIGAVEKHVQNILSKLDLPPPRPTTGACWPCSPTSRRRNERTPSAPVKALAIKLPAT
jgi:DNA-binding NarL/FixJ family response regulator